MSTPFFHKVFWFLALYFHLKVYHIEALSFVSVVFSSRQENRKECLKFLRQDLKCLFEVRGGNQFLSYFLSVIVLIFSCVMLNKWFVTHVWVFLCNLLFFLPSYGEWCFITFSAAGWKKTEEHKDQEKNVLDLILKLTNMAWITNGINSKNLAV